MPLTIDSHAVLRAVADHPEAFPAIQPDLDEIARKMVAKQIKAKSMDAELFRGLCCATGDANLSTILDGLAGNELTALVKKIDPYSAHARSGGDIQDVRRHVTELANGRVQPSRKAEKVVKAAAPKPPAKRPESKIGSVLGSKVHSGKAQGSRAKKSA